MPRTNITERLEIQATPPMVATLEHNGLRAMVAIYPVGPEDSFTSAPYIALLPDGRLRSGQLGLSCGTGDQVLDDFCTIPAPSSVEGFAQAIADDLVNADGWLSSEDGPAFTLLGWSPWDTSQMGMLIRWEGLHAVPGLEWLPQAPVEGPASLTQAWMQVMDGHVGENVVAAAGLFSRLGDVDCDAFDAACEPGPVGEARRDFVKANPFLANDALVEPAALALIDRGAPLSAILNELSTVEAVDLAVAGGISVDKICLRQLSGRYSRNLLNSPNPTALAALGKIPRRWIPTDDDEVDAFVDLSRCVHIAFATYVPNNFTVERWRSVLAGSGGHWRAYHDRVHESGLALVPMLRPSFGRTVGLTRSNDGLLDGSGNWGLAIPMAHVAQGRAHLVDDLLLPLARLNDCERLMELAEQPGDWEGMPNAPGKSALDTFAHRFVVEGMALPAVMAQGVRHRMATRDIVSVMHAFPIERESGARAWNDDYASYVTGGYKISAADRKRKAPYDWEAQGAVEAMLDAWKPALPRRFRGMGAVQLAAAFEGEARSHIGALSVAQR